MSGPKPCYTVISCPHSPLLTPSASVPSFSMIVQFQFAGFSQGCRSVHLGICFSKNILPFVFILYIGVWDPAAKKHWETTCLGHFCSVHCLQGWPRGAVRGPTSCCRVLVGMSGDGTWTSCLPCCSCSAWHWGHPSFGRGPASLFLFYSSLQRNTICALMSKLQVIYPLSSNALSRVQKKAQES